MTDLQRLCLYALEDMTLKELNDKYFGGHGIGWTKRLIAGEIHPHPLILESLGKSFDQKYHDRVAKHHEVIKSSRWGW